MGFDFLFKDFLVSLPLSGLRLGCRKAGWSLGHPPNHP
jgi:hypothetical protein